jgi:hypothetical protein
MQLDLARVLEATRQGQWSVDDFDWDQPLAGAETLSPPERRAFGQLCLLVAGLELHAAEIFRLNAHFCEDPQAREIFTWFSDDERRHAEALTRHAGRYGLRWSDLPLPTRAMFRVLHRNYRTPHRRVHEASSGLVVLFETLVPSLFTALLSSRVDDPLQQALFHRIDQDEAKHLLMDYWLLQRRGAAQGREGGLRRLRSLAENLPVVLTGPALWPVGFLPMMLELRAILPQLFSEAQQRRFWARIEGFHHRAPDAVRVSPYRWGLKLFQLVMSETHLSIFA